MACNSDGPRMCQDSLQSGTPGLQANAHLCILQPIQLLSQTKPGSPEFQKRPQLSLAKMWSAWRETREAQSSRDSLVKSSGS